MVEREELLSLTEKLDPIEVMELLKEKVNGYK